MMVVNALFSELLSNFGVGAREKLKVFQSGTIGLNRLITVNPRRYAHNAGVFHDCEEEAE